MIESIQILFYIVRLSLSKRNFKLPSLLTADIGVRGGGGGGGQGGQQPPQKNLKLKSWANFDHKLGKNLRNKAIHLNECTKKGEVKALKSPFPAIQRF